MTARSATREGRSWAVIALPAAGILCFLGVWEVASRVGWVNRIILPAPTEIAAALVKIGQTRYFWEATAVTVQETVYGFGLGCVGAWVIGMGIGMSLTFRRIVYPLAIAFQNMPRVALAPLFLVWFGFGLTSKVVMAAAICFFPLLIAVVVGLETVDRDARTLMRSLGASRWQMYYKLSLPSSLPYFFAGLKTAMTLALTGAIVAEFVGASEGMGVLIQTYNFQLNVAEGFATIFVLMIIGLLLFGLMEWLDRKLVFWQAKH
ncbi:ABC transporter permease [Mycolicibacterium baixiangningiae]|uniref:ABC transporter permease n=1 Tax=Mycolicibacterium baixiangningiae TaxID=2761578 RepID=UPI0018D18C80|nr:ABC transporter permease [Mycolicibacterium baixiangningiae]